uniref:Uncharacterized protein n=1 Tax=Acrobeloides nanus TaxID=290746 RepID=A0A914CDI3_9BILA
MAEGGINFSSSEESSPEMVRKHPPVKFSLHSNSQETNSIQVLKHIDSDLSIKNGMKANPSQSRRRSLSDQNLYSKAIMNNLSNLAKLNSNAPTTSSSEYRSKVSFSSYNQDQVPRVSSRSTLPGLPISENMATISYPINPNIDIEQGYHYYQHTCNKEEECWQRDCMTHKGRYNYELSKAKLKSSSGISAMLAGFSMVAIIELSYDNTISHPLLIILGIVTTLVVSVHLLSLMMSTCILAYVQAHGCNENSPHIKLWFYIELSWIFSTCIGLLLFLVMVGVVFFVKFNTAQYETAAYVTTAILIFVVIVFAIISYLIHRSRFSFSMSQMKRKFNDLEKIFIAQSSENECVKQI